MGRDFRLLPRTPEVLLLTFSCSLRQSGEKRDSQQLQTAHLAREKTPEPPTEGSLFFPSNFKCCHRRTGREKWLRGSGSVAVRAHFHAPSKLLQLLFDRNHLTGTSRPATVFLVVFKSQRLVCSTPQPQVIRDHRSAKLDESSLHQRLPMNARLTPNSSVFYFISGQIVFPSTYWLYFCYFFSFADASAN